MKIVFIPGLALLLLAGCQSVRNNQKHGMEWAPDENGRLNFITYVTVKEYQGMTKEERDREHAAISVGASTGWSWGKNKAPEPQSAVTRTLSSGELNKALANEPTEK